MLIFSITSLFPQLLTNLHKFFAIDLVGISRVLKSQTDKSMTTHFVFTNGLLFFQGKIFILDTQDFCKPKSFMNYMILLMQDIPESKWLWLTFWPLTSDLVYILMSSAGLLCASFVRPNIWQKKDYYSHYPCCSKFGRTLAWILLPIYPNLRVTSRFRSLWIIWKNIPISSVFRATSLWPLLLPASPLKFLPP